MSDGIEVVRRCKLRSDFDVRLVQEAGGDPMVCAAARVSTTGDQSLADFLANRPSNEGLISFLMKNRHGSPFEHGLMTFFISAPIFVFREFHRHRAGWSYNETSGRYKELEPVFYVPDETRPLEQTGKAGAYDFVPNWELHGPCEVALREGYEASWFTYQVLLAHGIAKEVARVSLPVGIYSSMYATCNPRSLMHFLSLRTKDPLSKFPSYPQWEIEQVAVAMEEQFSRLYPITYAHFVANGRVAP